jgi:uncharacterized protein (DUF305 family)
MHGYSLRPGVRTRWDGSQSLEGAGANGTCCRTAGDLEDLEAAEQFDKAFIEAMVPHHQMGIMMSQMAGSATSRTQLRDLTKSIVKGQGEEIAKMRDWYEEWYGR